VAIEATVLGTPVVATRVGGIPEILDGGRGGVLVEPDDPSGLAQALERVAADPEGARARAAHALARNRELFSLDRCVARHLEIYGA
jgi:glycosyltransferase involved in cell wall biosynthesis